MCKRTVYIRTLIDLEVAIMGTTVYTWPGVFMRLGIGPVKSHRCLCTALLVTSLRQSQENVAGLTGSPYCLLDI